MGINILIFSLHRSNNMFYRVNVLLLFWFKELLTLSTESYSKSSEELRIMQGENVLLLNSSKFIVTVSGSLKAYKRWLVYPYRKNNNTKTKIKLSLA